MCHQSRTENKWGYTSIKCTRDVVAVIKETKSIVGSIFVLAFDTSQIRNIIFYVLLGGMAIVFISFFISSKLKNETIQERMFIFVAIPFVVCFILGLFVIIALSIYDIFVAKPTPINLVYRAGIFSVGGLLVVIILLVLCSIGIEKIQNVTLKRILGTASSILGVVIFIFYFVNYGIGIISDMYDLFKLFPIISLGIGAVILVCVIKVITFLVKLFREDEKDKSKENENDTFNTPV
jgi:hypothetical protein